MKWRPQLLLIPLVMLLALANANAVDSPQPAKLATPPLLQPQPLPTTSPRPTLPNLNLVSNKPPPLPLIGQPLPSPTLIKRPLSNSMQPMARVAPAPPAPPPIQTPTVIPSLSAANAIIDGKTLNKQAMSGPVIVQAPPVLKPKRLWNLQNADIMSLIDEVSRETGKNFIVDPRVSGTVTVISSQPLDADELYQVFLLTLQVHGYSAVGRGSNVKILPSVDATQSFSKIATARAPGEGAEIVVRVVQLKYSPADQLVASLRNLVPSWASISAYIPANALIIAGTAASVSNIVSIINQIDGQNVTGVEMVALRYASAVDVVATLSNLENAERNAGQRIDTWLVADKRTNSVLISGSPQARMEMRSLIRELDTPYSSTVSLNTRVIFLYYLNAVKTAPILAKIAQGMGLKGAGPGSASVTSGTPAVPPNTNLPSGVQTPAAESMNPSGLGMDDDDNASTPVQSSLNIQADPATNSLIITAPPPLMQNLVRVINQLDQRPAQVMVEAAIVEIDQSDLKKLGIQWGTVPATTNNGAQGAINQVQYGVGLIQDGGFSNWFVLLSALERTTRSNILSTPSVVVLDNQKAVISVGKEFGVTTGSYATTGNATTATPFQTTQRESFNLELDVIPQITRGKALQLMIQQTNNALENPQNPGPNPISDTSKIKTSVIVNSGNILVLGGLLSNTTGSEESQPPILGDIPILGRLFQYHNNEVDKKELMVFLHPVILHSRMDNNNITEGRYNYMRQAQLRTIRAMKMRQEDRNLLPPWELNTSIPPPFTH